MKAEKVDKKAQLADLSPHLPIGGTDNQGPVKVEDLLDLHPWCTKNRKEEGARQQDWETQVRTKCNLKEGRFFSELRQIEVPQHEWLRS